MSGDFLDLGDIQNIELATPLQVDAFDFLGRVLSDPPARGSIPSRSSSYADISAFGPPPD